MVKLLIFWYCNFFPSLKGWHRICKTDCTSSRTRIFHLICLPSPPSHPCSPNPCTTTTQPPTVVCKMGAQLGYVHCVHIFAHNWCRSVRMLSRWLLTKFLHRSSVGTLIRVRCWLGKKFNLPIFQASFLLTPVWKKGQDFLSCLTHSLSPSFQSHAQICDF